MVSLFRVLVLTVTAASGWILGWGFQKWVPATADMDRMVVQVEVESVERPLSEVSLLVMPHGEAHLLTYDAARGRHEAAVAIPTDARLLLANAFYDGELVGHGVTTLPAPVQEHASISIRANPAIVESTALLGVTVEGALMGGLRFLAQTQLPWGEFGAKWCDDRWLDRNCRDFKSSTFPAAIIVYALSGIDDALGRTMAGAALDFLRSEQRPDGSWPYWSSRAEDMPGDVDTTALVAYVLTQAGDSLANREFLWANRTEDGLFWTWFDDFPFENDVDCVVNANALLYLGEEASVCAYVNQSVKDGETCSIYYEDELDLTYAASRAYAEGVSCLKDSREEMMTVARRRLNQPEGSALKTALALNTLLNLGDASPDLQEGVKRLLALQAPDGGWRAEGLYCVDCTRDLPEYFGSRELTTGIVLEALSKYQTEYPPEPLEPGFGEAVVCVGAVASSSEGSQSCEQRFRAEPQGP